MGQYKFQVELLEVVISTHGHIKKTDKTPKGEIEHAIKIREMYYFNEKNKKK